MLLMTAALIAMTVAGWPKGRGSAGLLPPVTLWVPAWFHLFFAGCFVALGFYRENVWMTVAASLNFAVGLGIHLYPYRIRARVHAAAFAADLRTAKRVEGAPPS